ncbi:MAG: FHA domain-containing protein, partial [Planctomycetia bacterium]
MPATLQVLIGKDAGKRFELTHDVVRLGRHPDCEIAIDLNAVSRFHAQMTKQGAAYLVEDSGSRNGTFVNGKKIEGRVS